MRIRLQTGRLICSLQTGRSTSLLSDTKSLYSTVMYGKGITNGSHFNERALSNIREFIQDDGQEFAYQRFIAPASASVRCAKALDRSVTGSINELIQQAAVWLVEGEVSPFDVGSRLNDILLSTLAHSRSVPYGKPRDVFRAMIDQVGS